RRDLAERNAPTGFRSALEWTHPGRLRHVLDLLGDWDRRGAAPGRFVSRLLGQRGRVVRRWWADSADIGGLTRHAHPLPVDVSTPRLYSISCSGPEDCWLAGWGSAPNGSPL